MTDLNSQKTQKQTEEAAKITQIEELKKEKDALTAEQTKEVEKLKKEIEQLEKELAAIVGKEKKNLLVRKEELLRKNDKLRDKIGELRLMKNTSTAIYTQIRDGQLMPILAMTPAQFFYNIAMLPGWQKWKPIYRFGTITKLNGDIATVNLEEIKSSQTQTDKLIINQKTTIENVPFDYMDCHHKAFKENDVVLVKFTGQAFEAPVIIGFKDNPRPCNTYIVHIVYNKIERLGVFIDLTTQDIFDVIDPKSETNEKLTQPYSLSTYTYQEIVTRNKLVNIAIEHMNHLHSPDQGNMQYDFTSGNPFDVNLGGYGMDFKGWAYDFTLVPFDYDIPELADYNGPQQTWDDLMITTGNYDTYYVHPVTDNTIELAQIDLDLTKVGTDITSKENEISILESEISAMQQNNEIETKIQEKQAQLTKLNNELIALKKEKKELLQRQIELQATLSPHNFKCSIKTGVRLLHLQMYWRLQNPESAFQNNDQFYHAITICDPLQANFINWYVGHNWVEGEEKWYKGLTFFYPNIVFKNSIHTRLQYYDTGTLAPGFWVKFAEATLTDINGVDQDIMYITDDIDNSRYTTFATKNIAAGACTIENNFVIADGASAAFSGKDVTTGKRPDPQNPEGEPVIIPDGKPIYGDDFLESKSYFQIHYNIDNTKQDGSEDPQYDKLTTLNYETILGFFDMTKEKIDDEAVTLHQPWALNGLSLTGFLGYSR